MLTFLAPFALAGLFLLAIPIAVHLFRPRKMRPTSFSSLRWLRLTQQRISRRIRWHQVLLFLLRAAFVVLLVLTLARPLFSPQSEGRAVDRFLVLDVGRSMAVQTGGQPTPLQRAKVAALALARQNRSGDRTALLLAGSTPRILTPLTDDVASYLGALDAAQPEGSDTNLGGTLPVIRSLLAQNAAERDIEVYFLTDNSARSWSQPAIAAFQKDLAASVRVKVVEVGVSGVPNAWIAGARVLSPAAGSNDEEATPSTTRLLRVEMSCTSDGPLERTLFITGLPEGGERTQAVSLAPGETTTVEIDVSGLDLRGRVAHLRLEPANALPDDDHFDVNLDPPALNVLLIDASPGRDQTLRPGFHLARALEALDATTSPATRLVRRTPARVTASDVADAELVLLADVPALPEDVVAALETRVKAGGGLVIFLGPSVNPEFYNTRLFEDGLLPCPLQAVGEPQTGRPNPAPLTGVRWSHRLLAPLNDPLFGDLPGCRFQTFYRFASPPSDGDSVLAWIDDDVPALVERTVGNGKVLLFNTTANDAWSNLPRRPSFVALVDQLLTYLAPGRTPRSFTVGQPAVLSVPGWQAGETVTVRGPDGKTLKPSLRTVGGRTLLRLDGVNAPGVYGVERTGGSAEGFSFVANVGRASSSLTPMDSATLTKWWAPAEIEVLAPERILQGPTSGAGPWPLGPWLLTLAGVFLLAEMFFVHRLCPRASPSATRSVVQRREATTAP